MKLCVVSDSLTNTAPDNWSQIVAAESGHEVAVEAHGGWTTRSYFKPKFDGVAFAQVPPAVDVLILLIGSNNLFEDRGGGPTSVHEACEGVERIADRVRRESPDARVLLVAPPRVVLEKLPPDSNTQGDRLILPETLGWLERLGDAYRKVAERNGWTYLTLFPLLDKADFADAAHPNAAGNRKMADAVLRALPRSTRDERLRREPNL